MLPIPSTLRGRVVGASAVLLAVGCLTSLISPVFSRGLDRNQQCVSNVKRISLALLQYCQDYDEHLPQPVVFSSLANYQSTLNPYTRDNSVYFCPANGNKPYILNAALGGTTLAQYPNSYIVEIARDSKPHPDGKLTVSFLDGHAERGGVPQFVPDVDCRQNMKQAYNAFLQYTQDYDMRFPFQPNDADFRQALMPYTRTPRVLICPDTAQFYNINRDIRGTTFEAFPDTAPIILFQDSVPHRNGTVTTAYLDGYIEQRGPQGVTFPDSNPSPDKTLTNFKHLGLALNEYAQDYDEHLPIYNNYPELLQEMKPYLSGSFNGYSSRTFEMLSNQSTYQADPAFSGVSFSSVQFPADAIYLRDVYDFGDGLITVGYIDGHANRIPAPTKPKAQARSGPKKGGK